MNHVHVVVFLCVDVCVFVFVSFNIGTCHWHIGWLF